MAYACKDCFIEGRGLVMQALQLEALGEDVERLRAALKAQEDATVAGAPIDEEEVLGSLAPLTYFWVNSTDQKEEIR